MKRFLSAILIAMLLIGSAASVTTIPINVTVVAANQAGYERTFSETAYTTVYDPPLIDLDVSTEFREFNDSAGELTCQITIRNLRKDEIAYITPYINNSSTPEMVDYPLRFGSALNFQWNKVLGWGN